ncbi:MAG: hypothetical protein AAGJ10_15755 [Bacteroidota bacterium]
MPEEAEEVEEQVEYTSMLDFVRVVNPWVLQFEHVPRMLAVLDRLIDGELTNVMVLMPPRYLKSELFSRLLPAYYLHRFPTNKVGLASYGANLAWELSEEARNYFRAGGGIVRSETAAKRRWRCAGGGEMWADGTGGTMIGRGYHLGIIDDPMDPQQAHSATYQKRFRDWYPSKFLSRAEPGGQRVLVMQRLAPNDPVDFLWQSEQQKIQSGEQTESWHIVCFDEVKSNAPLAGYGGPMGLPKSCTLEPDPRPVGAVLAPTRFNEAEVKTKQAASGVYVTNAQRQQRPAQPTGDFWRQDWFQVYDELPQAAENGGKDWDTAYTKNEANSASAYVESYRDRSGDIYIHDCGWEWYEFPALVAWMRRVGGPHHVEDKASGKSALQTLRDEGIEAQAVPVKGGDKFARAQSVQSVVSGPLDPITGLQLTPGRVHVRRAIYDKLLKGHRQGLMTVTAEGLIAGNGDLDLNDAFVQALNRHSKKKPQRRRSGGRVEEHVTY